jgi:hypothetical protein
MERLVREMTQLEAWGEQYWLTLPVGEEYPRQVIVEAFKAGYELAVKHVNTPSEPCPPGHDCPDCSHSYVEGIED